MYKKRYENGEKSSLVVHSHGGLHFNANASPLPNDDDTQEKSYLFEEF